MQTWHPIVLLVAVVLFLVAAYFTAEREGKLLALGLALLALALWGR